MTTLIKDGEIIATDLPEREFEPWPKVPRLNKLIVVTAARQLAYAFLPRRRTRRNHK